MKYPDIKLGRVEAVWNKLGGEEGVTRFLSGDLIVTAVEKPAPVPAPVVTDLPKIIFLPVDYSMSLDQMIAAGNYDWKNSDLTAKRYPIKGEGIQEFEFELIHPDRSISSENAIKEMEKDSDPSNPWFAAKTEHLLAFGAAFPEIQRKFPIIALGSVAKVDGSRHVPCLDGDGSRRSLYLYYDVYVWFASYRFLRVRRKVSKA